MGITDIEGVARGTRNRKVTVRFLVDSGAKYTVLPIDAWKRIGLRPKRSMDFVLADGTTIERDISECYLVLPQGEGHTPVVLGQGSDEALLGVVTLEELGLVFNPFTRELRPARMMLAVS